MPYEAALAKAWDETDRLTDPIPHSVALLGDTYEVDVNQRRIYSLSCNVPAKDFLAILLLHYLAGLVKNCYSPSGEWVSFKDIESGEIYYPAFREGAINPIIRKYGRNPEALLEALKRFSGKKVSEGDVGIEIGTFDNITVKIILWKADEEFGPEATMLFDRNLTRIFSMEDITVFLRLVAHSI